jgi:hypothetical protein
MMVWARIASGWATNLDGSDAAAVFSLPRLEVHPSVRGWRSLCLRQDGTRTDRPGQPGDTAFQAREAAEAAWRVKG